MNMMLLTGLLALNIAISWWCATMVGRIWVASQVLGGLPRLIAWAGTAQAICGFNLVTAVLVFHAVQPTVLASPRTDHALWSMVDVAIILPMLGAALAAAIGGWVAARGNTALEQLDLERRQYLERVRAHYARLDSAPLALLYACGFVGASGLKRDDRMETLVGIGGMLLGGVLCLASSALLTRTIVLANAAPRPRAQPSITTAAQASKAQWAPAGWGEAEAHAAT